MTVWKPIPGHEGLYEVSSEGQVRSLGSSGVDKLGRTYSRPGRDLRVRVKEGKHLQVCLGAGGTKNYFSVRVLVAKTFLEEPLPGESVVRFKDGDVSNCRADNLFYGTSLHSGGKPRVSRPAREERKPATFDFALEPWTERALCKGRPIGAHDTSSLPPSSSNAHRKAARKLCEGCPVLGECADYAVRTKATGVVMAGVPIKSHSNTHIYAELRGIAGLKGEK